MVMSFRAMAHEAEEVEGNLPEASLFISMGTSIVSRIKAGQPDEDVLQARPAGREREDFEVLPFGIRDDRGKDRRWIVCEEPDLVPLLAHLVYCGNVHEPVLHLRHLPVEPDLHGLDRLDGLFQTLGGVDGRDLPVVDDGHPVAGEVRLLDVVGGEEDGDPFLREFPDHPPDDEVGLHVEARGRFVEEEEPRVVDKPHREGQAPLHPLGEAVGKVVLSLKGDRRSSGAPSPTRPSPPSPHGRALR